MIRKGVCFCLLICLTLLLHSCGQKSNGRAHKPNYIPADSLSALLSGLEEGDIVLRAGNDVTSNMLRQLNLKDKRFSHCGIVFSESGAWWVYHSIGSESAPDQAIKKEPLMHYWNPEDNLAIGYAHLHISRQERAKLLHTTDSLYRLQIPFDMQFDLKSDDRMYCTEMVAKSIQWSIPEAHLQPTDTLGRQYWAVDNIIRSTLVSAVHYLQVK
ncbi:YiiX/YebB-like N1pC/P60 family cysteine hydrolase [Edaphocola aurantiacus]|uniref:YiiX/YebB-like N1pC/P60 family cysteine hydrolase n=1 Tax=Edaphocola aurantiacus TaxID=2601682 RepID=UPI001C9565D7|nr:YiiX/YebB-like N1pC/P60 family cysteine hydrolase [Edaphocola aurantiacus]